MAQPCQAELVLGAASRPGDAGVPSKSPVVKADGEGPPAHRDPSQPLILQLPESGAASLPSFLLVVQRPSTNPVPFSPPTFLGAWLSPSNSSLPTEHQGFVSRIKVLCPESLMTILHKHTFQTQDITTSSSKYLVQLENLSKVQFTTTQKLMGQEGCTTSFLSYVLR